MYKRVLAAVNEFTNSEIAARYALSLAGACRARLSLLFIAGEGIHPDVLRRAESALERLFMAAEEAGVEVESITLTGDPVTKIPLWAAGNGIDIAFIGTRREDVKRRFFVKTVARELMVKLTCSVVMVRAVRMGKTHPRHILVPLGGLTGDIEEKAYFVASIAEGFGSKVTLFHLPEPITRFFHGEVHLKPAQREDRLPADMVEFAGAMDRYGIASEVRTARGEVARVITAEAAVRRNDLIVMGPSRRSLVSRLVKGNPVEEVLRETPCDLMIFRPGHANPHPRNR